jgi:DNA repair exonuclease SbcCD ATPase subunit
MKAHPMMTNEELKMTTNQPRSVGRRFLWVIRTTLLILIMIGLSVAVLAGLGYAGILGVQEIQRSDNNLAMRIDANEQNLSSLRDLINAEFSKGDSGQQVQLDELENELTALNSQLDVLQADRAEDTAVQTEQIDGLEAELATAVAQNSNLSSDLETVQAALVALQSDFNDRGSQLDELGGDLDRLRLQLSALDSNLTELSAETAARSENETDVQQSITLLQLWTVLTNARLYLIDDNVVLAETAVSQAILLAATLTAEPDTPAADALQRLQTRLVLAADGFATDSTVAAQDLEAASAELTLLMNIPTADAEALATPTPLEATEATTATPPPSETPTPGATPLPSPTPTATP